MKALLVLVLCSAGLGYTYSASLRVVDGNEVTKNSIPYQAHVYMETDFGGHWNCTGVLISENYVLTTSKCQWAGATRVTVLLGAHNISEAESSQQSYYTKDSWKIYNEDFAFATLENNIALVKLPTPATLNEYVQVAELPSLDNVTVGQTGIISGWGVLKGHLETVLQAASATIVENSVCASTYTSFYTGDTTICVQGDNGASACFGDDGAPLVIDGVVVAVFSAGPVYTSIRNCANKPNIFTNVGKYLDWIKANSDIK